MATTVADAANALPPRPWPAWARRLWLGWLLLVFWGLYLAMLPAYGLLLALPARWRWTRDAAHALNVAWGCGLLAAWLSWPQVRRLAPLPHGPCIYVANHRSYLDIPAAHVALRRQFRYLAKAELNRVPLFGFMYRRLHLTFDRADSRQAARALVQAQQLLAAGTSVFIFPEGTTQRRAEGLLGPFKEGAFVLAVRSGCPVVPLVLQGTAEALSADGRFWTQPADVRVTVGAPIYPAGADAATLSARTRAEMLRIFAAG